MANPRVRRVSFKTRRVRVSSSPSPVSPLLLMLLMLPSYCIYLLGEIVPTFTKYLSLYLIFINIWTCILYQHDKAQSRILGAWRVGEKSLHICELAGGWPAAYFSQRLFQHKTHKAAYQISFWLIVLVHEALWFWLLWAFFWEKW